MNQSALKSAFAWGKVTRAFLGAALLGLVAAGSTFAIGKVGDMAGDWTGLKDLDGNTNNLKDYQGKVVFLMTVQWNCGGCNADAPKIGDLGKKYAGPTFQAVGADINHGTVAELRTFEKNLKKTATDVKFPLLTGIPDAQIVNTDTGTKWTSYNALRDVFFIIDHTGKIAARIDGNRGNYMGDANFAKIENAIKAAIAAVPTTSLGLSSGNQDMCLRACKRAGQYQIALDPAGMKVSGDVTLRILDPQGRVIRNLDWNPSQSGSTGERQAIWDGMDSKGQAVSWGSYFLNAASPASSLTLLISWLP